ncbi:hypothetical protein A2524_01015 [Candidatus Wolfebacteria bacterium RIFOXYD12_FULL_48_21]|uniref:Uncharacterized protein n=1 Tax=Candidatus Wolfebacteria bacterium RIFOXYD1_FULL_48_65 TaxID=1802561 RepID=A0A1F8E0D9_9BACT|nr:MAG: hypothetical protein A2610_02960 [Candidatus Wolfebacteria bacterium RIFOXYD1_FULL_48_65]OGM94389.1 MAG: hypothetical protein A2524_01015 [Candidatus Wolfebacteria bacterium RIFOXYD12_FULL_48_21]
MATIFTSIIIFAIALLVVGGAILFFMRQKERKVRMKQALDLSLLLLRFPRIAREERERKDFKDEINLSAQLYSTLLGLKVPFALEVAVHHVGEEIHFYVGVPKGSMDPVRRQIEGLFAEVQVEPIDDYNIFNATGVSAGVYVKQRYSYALPIRTYQEANVDTFSSILSGFSKVSEVGEGAALQVLVRPAPESSKKSIFKMIGQLRHGEKFEDVLQSGSDTLALMKKIAAGAPAEQPMPEQPRIVNEDAVKALESKVGKSLVLANVRIVTSAINPLQSEDLLNGIASGFAQFSAPFRQELRIAKPKQLQRFLRQYSFREFDDATAICLNTEEIASLFHMPTPSLDVPRVKALESREAAPPENLPTEGTLIGENSFRGDVRPIYLTPQDRMRHVYAIGQTGTGKSTLLVQMALEDIRQGKGVCIIDPHGELVDKTLSLIPEHRYEDVIVFDPADIASPMGLNMLEYDFSRPEQKSFIVDELYGIMDKLYDMKTSGGPMFELYMKNAVLLLMEDAPNEPATLMEIQRLFTDDAFRERKLARIHNPVVIDFWEKEAAKASGEHSLANMSAYITSKFNVFTTNDFMRPIIGQPHSAFNFRQAMDEGKILLISLSKGKIGDFNMGLLGMVIVGKILMAALSRTDIPEAERKEFNLYLDEFQNFTTDAISTIFSEARKYALSLTVAHQYIGQMSDKIRTSVFGNVGSKIILRVGMDDAEVFERDLVPTFTKNDLTNLKAGQAYAKLLLNGQVTRPFNLQLVNVQWGDRSLVEKLRELSRLKYGRNRAEVEEEILHRLRL